MSVAVNNVAFIETSDKDGIPGIWKVERRFTLSGASSVCDRRLKKPLSDGETSLNLPYSRNPVLV